MHKSSQAQLRKCFFPGAKISLGVTDMAQDAWSIDKD